MLEWECNCVLYLRDVYITDGSKFTQSPSNRNSKDALQIVVVSVLHFRSRYFLGLSTVTDSMDNEFSTFSLLLTYCRPLHTFLYNTCSDLSPLPSLLAEMVWQVVFSLGRKEVSPSPR
jgi:hypothetical protein